MKILVDFHHNSLLRSLVLLFENRLGASVYRPVGMDWYYEGYWAINDQLETAKQFLDFETQIFADNTPALNIVQDHKDGVYKLYDPGHKSHHKGILLESFKSQEFDYVIASIPQHIHIFQNLIDRFQPKAKLIVQIGNNWHSSIFHGMNVMASVKPGTLSNANVVYYHQEFDTNIFKPKNHSVTKSISSYINILQNMPNGWKDFTLLENLLMEDGVAFRSYGGQCRDGNKAGAQEVADSMSNDDFVFHVKDNGDGYGHIIYNAYACGKPVILRRSDYSGQLAEELINDNNSIDLDRVSHKDCADMIRRFYLEPEKINTMSLNAYQSFIDNVDFAHDAENVGRWIANI